MTLINDSKNLVRDFVQDCICCVNLKSMSHRNVDIIKLWESYIDICNEVYFKSFMLTILDCPDQKFMGCVNNIVEHMAGVAEFYISCLKKKILSAEIYDAFVEVINFYRSKLIVILGIINNDYMTSSCLQFYIEDNPDVYKESLKTLRGTDVNLIASKIKIQYGDRKLLSRKILDYDESNIRDILKRHAVAIELSYVYNIPCLGVDLADIRDLRDKLYRTGKNGIVIGTRLSGRSKGKLYYVSGRSGIMKSDMFNAVTLDSLQELNNSVFEDSNLILEFVTLK